MGFNSIPRVYLVDSVKGRVLSYPTINACNDYTPLYIQVARTVS